MEGKKIKMKKDGQNENMTYWKKEVNYLKEENKPPNPHTK